jgi:hypothetical protein
MKHVTAGEAKNIGIFNHKVGCWLKKILANHEKVKFPGGGA